MWTLLCLWWLIYHCNTPAKKPEQNYEQNVAVPLINHIKAEPDEQFSVAFSVSYRQLLCDMDGDFPNADEITNTYKDDLPSPEPLSSRTSLIPGGQAKFRWHAKLQRSAIMIYFQIYMHSSRYPQILERAVNVKRSVSSLRQLHTYNRACTGQERLSSLTLTHIHYQVKIHLDDVNETWKAWLKELPKLQGFSTGQYFKPSGFGEVASAQLHYFSDASEIVYGAVSYLRLVNAHGDVHCSFVTGKFIPIETKGWSFPLPCCLPD
ncbi:hypothetical protein P5673_018834 [Acropora cervicornis]|uniref:Uncharacterized protein n=1 Tax=Acropora cervicornis TaxID=6130 RepID=A0AAD9QD17_ACRCE|nr:hypothetical protein P5673_018834 [Acropora cervicornis]